MDMQEQIPSIGFSQPEGWDKWSKYNLYEPTITAGGDETGFKTIVKDGKYVQVVSQDYYLFPNEEALMAADKAAQLVGVERFTGNFPGVRTEDGVAWSKRGARMRAIYLYPQTKDVDGDKINIGVQVYNSIDRSTSFGAGLFSYRSICSNGAIVGMKDITKLKQMHRSGLDNIVNDLVYRMTQLLEEGDGLIKSYNQMAQRKINEEMVDKLRWSYLSGRVLPDYIMEPEKKYDDLTEWDLYNDITEAIWHNEKAGEKTKAYQFQVLHKVMHV